MSDLTVSPLAPKTPLTILPVAGVEIAAVAAGIKYKNRLDLMLAVVAEGSASAGVFTKSKAPSAAVDWSKRVLGISKGSARVLVVNSGNANAFTGVAGEKAAMATATSAAKAVGCDIDDVLLASTGVIGEPLNVAPIKKYLPILHSGISTNLWVDAAKAIMTTDTFAKGGSRTTHIGNNPVVISGFAKGSGMIAPDMATMLGFIFTDAKISAACLQGILRDTSDKSFNSITVDSDTSTSDTVLAFATGKAGNDLIEDPNDPLLGDFKIKFAALMTELAHMIVRDGEGASKFVEITVTGAENDVAAKVIALAVANSPLVKTAIAGEDPNWGRIVMAVGKSGEAAERDKLKISIGDQVVAEKGAVHRHYSEDKAAAHMQGEVINITVDVGVASGTSAGKSTIWTCDFTAQYISINADYRS